MLDGLLPSLQYNKLLYDRFLHVSSAYLLVNKEEVFHLLLTEAMNEQPTSSLLLYTVRYFL